MHIDNNDYTNVPAGQIWIHHSWSGDMAASWQYLPKGVPADVIGYWFPADGKGPTANDTITVLNGAQNPVLAHLFLNYLQDLPNSLTNISYNGYMQPVYGVTPARLVHEGILPKALNPRLSWRRTSGTACGSFSCPSRADLAWQQAWQVVSLGI